MINRIRLIDWLSRKRSWQYYKEYCESQWYDRRRLDQYRVAKLRRLLAHCEQHVPFYGDVMRRAGVRSHQVDTLDVLSCFPVMDKTAIKAAYGQVHSQTMSGLGTIRYSQTGGTTGEPLRVPKDVALRSSAQASMFRFYGWMGVHIGDPMLVLWGAPVVAASLGKRLRDRLLGVITNTRQVNTFGISPADVPALATIFREERPRLLHGYCQSIYELAQWFVAAGQHFPLKAVSTTVEPLFPQYRAVIRKAFGCETFDQYGCGEVEAIAMECPSHQGLHVVEERVVLEIDPQGSVIVTDLDNLALPFIRYRNGDQAVAGQHSCDCGRIHQLLERILGRIGDVIIGPNGKRVHPEFFTHLLNETGIAERRHLRRYQVVQEGANRLRWKLVADRLEEGDRRWLTDHVRAYLGAMDVRIEEVDDIPAARSGKFQYVIVER